MKSRIAKIPENIHNEVKKVSERFKIPQNKAIGFLVDDSEIIDVKQQGGRKNRFLEVTYKKRFRF